MTREIFKKFGQNIMTVKQLISTQLFRRQMYFATKLTIHFTTTAKKPEICASRPVLLQVKMH